MSKQSTIETAVVVIAACVAQGLFWRFSMPGPQLFDGHTSWHQGILDCLIAVVTLMVGPMAVAAVLQWSPKRVGLGNSVIPGEHGKKQTGMRAVAIVTPLFVLGTLVGSSDPEIMAFYPMVGDGIGRWPGRLVIWWSAYLAYYIAFEFFYRGFLLRGFAGQGMWTCIAIQTIACFLVHLGKPTAELYASIPASLVLGWIAWNTRSIWYGVVIHFLVGITNDVAALWQRETLDWF